MAPTKRESRARNRDAALPERRVRRESGLTEEANPFGHSAEHPRAPHRDVSRETSGKAVPNLHGLYIRAGDSSCKMRDGGLSAVGVPGTKNRASLLGGFMIFKFLYRHGSRGALRRLRCGYVRIDFRPLFSIAAIRLKPFDGSGQSGFSNARSGRANSRTPCPPRCRPIEAANRFGQQAGNRSASSRCFT